MKKFSKIVLILIMLTLCICMVTACDDDNSTKVTGISISEANMPQTVFVKGNELNLSAGKLTVATGKGKSDEIALNAEGVSVTGYDKNTTGEQTLTISYLGATTTLTVNVVERFVAENNVTKEYVVGEACDKAGRLTVTNDDGTTFVVPIKDQKVEVTDFDSSTPGEKKVSLVYTDGNVEYTGSYPVTVYAVESVKLVAPNKIFYNSHETELDLSGAYFVVKANGGKLQKSVLMNDNKITGFDPNTVTEDNPQIKQQIHIDFAGFDTTYNVTITLSDVTRVKRAYASIKDQNLTNEIGELAMNSQKLVNTLSDDDLSYITDEEKNLILYTAVAWGKEAWDNAIGKYADVFTVNNNSLILECAVLDQTRQLYTELAELTEDDMLFVYGDIFYYALLNSSEEIFRDDITYGEYLSNVCDSKAIKNAIAQVDYLIKMNDTLSRIPVGVEMSELNNEQNSAIIEETYGYMVELGKLCAPVYDRYIFDIASRWRNTSDEFYYIMYRYYYDMTTSEDEQISQKGMDTIDSMMNMCMPRALENFYTQFFLTMIEQFDLEYSANQNGGIVQPAQSVDTLGFVINYRMLEKINEAIKAIDDDMIQVLYNTFGFGDNIIRLQTADFGYLKLMGAACGEPEFEAIWNKYIDVVSSIEYEGDHFTAESAEKTEDLFKSFVALTPELQKQFLASLNPYGSAEFFPSDGTDRMTMFTQLFVLYYQDILPTELLVINENEDGIVYLMLAAMQYYMFRDQSFKVSETETSTYLNVFLDTMKSIDKLYGELSAENKALFNNHIGFMYDSLKSVAGHYDVNGKFIQTTFTEEWQEQIKTLRLLYQNLSTYMVKSIQDYTFYPVFISLYENTVNIYNDIMTNAPQDVQDYVLHCLTDVFSDISATLETDLYLFRSVYISYLSNYPYNEEAMMVIWNEYQASNIRDYFVSLLDLYIAGENDMNKVTEDFVKNALSGFIALTDEEKELFIAMDGNGTFFYYQILKAYFSRFAFADSSANAVLADALIQIQIDSVSKFVYDSEYIEAWDAIASQYANLNEKEKEAFDSILGETYNYYKNIYDEIKASQGDQSGDNQ